MTCRWQVRADPDRARRRERIPSSPPPKKHLRQQVLFFNEINPSGIYEMRFAREESVSFHISTNRLPDWGNTVSRLSFHTHLCSHLHIPQVSEYMQGCNPPSFRAYQYMYPVYRRSDHYTRAYSLPHRRTIVKRRSVAATNIRNDAISPSASIVESETAGQTVCG